MRQSLLQDRCAAHPQAEPGRPGRRPSALFRCFDSAIERDVTGLVAGDGDAEALVHPRDGDIHADAIGHVLGHPAVRGPRSLRVDGVELRAGHQRLRQPVAGQQHFDGGVVLGLDGCAQGIEFGGVRIDPVDRRLRGIADRADVGLGIGRARIAGRCGTAPVTVGHGADRRDRPRPRTGAGGAGIGPDRRILQHHAFGRDTVIRVVAFGAGFPGVRACRDQEENQRAGTRELQMRHLRSPSDGVCLHPTGDVVGCKGGNRIRGVVRSARARRLQTRLNRPNNSTHSSLDGFNPTIRQLNCEYKLIPLRHRRIGKYFC